jgi:hypothetical protein
MRQPSAEAGARIGGAAGHPVTSMMSKPCGSRCRRR